MDNFTSYLNGSQSNEYATQCLQHLISDGEYPSINYQQLNGSGQYIALLESIRNFYGTPAARQFVQSGQLTITSYPDTSRPVEPSTESYFIHASELANMPPVEWLVKGRIPQGSLVAVYGQPASFKSTHVLDIALNIAQQNNVVYIAAEGARGYNDRFEAWKKHNGLGEGGLFFKKSAVDLSDNNAVDELIQQLLPLHPALVTLDTLARCMDGDETNARDMGVVINSCSRIIQATGATVLLVHHTKKNSNEYRGSSALGGACDTMILVTRNKKSREVTVTCQKMKDDAEFEEYKLKPKTVSLEGGRSSVVLVHVNDAAPIDKDTSADSKPSIKLTKNRLKVLKAIARPEFSEVGAKNGQIKKATKLVASSLGKVLNWLIAQDLASQSEKGEPYFITELGTATISSHPEITSPTSEVLPKPQ